MSNNNKLFVVYSIEMINYLIRQGNDMIKMADSDKDPSGDYKVGLFEDTDKLQDDIAGYMRYKTEKKIERYKHNRIRR